jgi:hypothetical protein
MEIRSYVATGLTATADVFVKRAGRLPRTPSVRVRGRALVDLMQGLVVRAKAGIEPDQLLQDARSYVSMILASKSNGVLRGSRLERVPHRPCTHISVLVLTCADAALKSLQSL